MMTREQAKLEMLNVKEIAEKLGFILTHECDFYTRAKKDNGESIVYHFGRGAWSYLDYKSNFHYSDNLLGMLLLEMN